MKKTILLLTLLFTMFTPPVMQEECIEIFMDVEFIFYACPRQ